MLVDLSRHGSAKPYAPRFCEALHLFVKVAGFVTHRDHRYFRLVIDPQLDAAALKAITSLVVHNKGTTYKFSELECITLPVDDHTPHRSATQSGIRVTYRST